MRVYQTDLDDSVVEDGEAATILISDDKSVTTKNRDMNSSSGHPLNGVKIPNGFSSLTGKHLKKAMVSADSSKQREPVEDCEEEDGGEVKGAVGEDILDSLTHSMKGVSIQETASLEIEGRLAELKVNDKEEEEEEEDTRCASLQSQSSVITVDPPSLPHEEEEEKGEVAEDLASRGPTAGKPTSFRPNQDKAYTFHNLDRFHPSLATTSFQPQTSGFVHDTFYSKGMSEVPAPALGCKRLIDDDEETPFKYTRPVEEMGYMASGGSGCQQEGRKGVAYFSQVSADLSCGGNVVDSSMTPEELARSMTRSYKAQLSITDVDQLLQSFSQYEQNGSSSMPREHDAGYSSENSPPSDNLSSPGSSPKSVFSPPMRPPSILSQDSGIASPFSEDTVLSTVLPSPPENSSQQRGWVDSPGNSAMASYSSPPGAGVYQSPPHSRTVMSPPSTAQYHSPPSAGQYHSPPSVTQSSSPSSVTRNQYYSPPSMSQPEYHSPQSVTQHEFHSPPSVTRYSFHSPPSVTQSSSPPRLIQYHSPPSVASIGSAMSPYNMLGSEEHFSSTSSTPSPPLSTAPHLGYSLQPEDALNDYIFNSRRDELRDALDVIAKDIINSDKKKPAPAATGATTTAGQQQMGQKIAPATTPLCAPTNLPLPVPSTLPLMVSQQQKSGGGGRPEKLPIAPLPKSGRGVAQCQQQMAPVMKGAVPVMVVPRPMPVASHPQTSATSTHNPVTSASVLLMNPGQNPMILVVNGSNPQQTGQESKKKLKKILPRPGPTPADSTNPKSICPKTTMGKGEVASSTTTTITTTTTTKQEPGSGVEGRGGVVAEAHSAQNSHLPTQAPAPPCQDASCSPTSSASSASKKKMGSGCTPAQSKMLNIARRLVASMTTTDLQFQDSEGDTYLHVSVCKADKNMVQALLERMSRENLQGMINTQNLMRQTPLYLAVSANSPEMVELLIQYGADINLFAEHTRADGKTTEVKAALHCAASHGESYLPTLQTLLTAPDLNIDLVNSEGHTALHCAILEHGKADSEGGIINNLPIIQALIEHRADPNAQGKKSGKTALMYALESRDLTLIEHMVSLIDPALLRTYLKTPAFDGSTCQRFMENLQRSLDIAGRQRLHACFRITTGRNSNSVSTS